MPNFLPNRLPSKFSGLARSDRSYNTVTIRWDPYLHEDELEEYKIVVKEKCLGCGTSDRPLLSNNSSKTINDLKAATEHDVSVLVKAKTFGESVPKTITIYTNPSKPLGKYW